MIKLSDLLALPRNVKKHDLDAIWKSIRRFGFVAPVVVDAGTGYIVAGHGRVEALRDAAGRGEPPPQRIVTVGSEWLVPTVQGIAFASEQEAEAYAIADNHLTEAGGWDHVGLGALLSELQANESLEGLGYSDTELNRLIKIASASDEGIVASSKNPEDGAKCLMCPSCGYEFNA